MYLHCTKSNWKKIGISFYTSGSEKINNVRNKYTCNKCKGNTIDLITRLKRAVFVYIFKSRDSDRKDCSAKSIRPNFRLRKHFGHVTTTSACHNGLPATVEIVLVPGDLHSRPGLRRELLQAAPERRRDGAWAAAAAATGSAARGQVAWGQVSRGSEIEIESENDEKTENNKAADDNETTDDHHSEAHHDNSALYHSAHNYFSQQYARGHHRFHLSDYERFNSGRERIDGRCRGLD